MRFLIALVVGVAIGYFAGFGDAKAHDENIVTRTVNNVGGSNRKNMKNNGDQLADSVTADSAATKKR